MTERGSESGLSAIHISRNGKLVIEVNTEHWIIFIVFDVKTPILVLHAKYSSLFCTAHMYHLMAHDFISNHNIPFVFRVLLLVWSSPFTVTYSRACLILLRIDKIILIISPPAGGPNVVKLPEKVWTAAKVAFILILLGHLFVPILR